MTSQTDVDRILGAWLSEGSERAPKESLRAALLKVAMTPQKRVLRPRWIRADIGATGHPGVVYAAVSAALIAILAVGVSIGAGLLHLPVSSFGPHPLPSPVEGPDGQRTYQYPDAGFEISLDDRWRLTSGEDPTTLTATRFDLRIFISSGDSGGRVQMCPLPVGSWEECGPIQAPNLTALAAAIQTGIPQEDEFREVTDRGPSELDGEPASAFRITAGDSGRRPQFIAYRVAIHEGRPFVIRFWSTSARSMADIDTVLSSFAFLDPDDVTSLVDGPDASSGSGYANESRTHRYAAAGFEVDLDASWRVTSGSDPTELTATLVGNGMRLFISSGDETGVIRTCETPAGPWEECGPTIVHDQEALQQAIHVDAGRSDHGVAPSAAIVERGRLGYQPAILQHWEGYEHPARGGQALAWIATMHDGRPFVMRLWSSGNVSLRSLIDDMALGFRFVDPPDNAGGSDPDLDLVPYENASAGYRLLLPRSWIPTAIEAAPGVFPDSLATAFGHPEGEFANPRVLTISVGPAGATGLMDVARMLRSAGCGDHGELIGFTFLGSERAWIEEPDAAGDCQGYPGYRYHVFTLHDGRPVALTFDYWFLEFGRVMSRAQGWAMVEQMVDSFEFTDHDAAESLSSPRPAGDGSYRVTIPNDWIEVEGGASGIRAFRVEAGGQTWPVMTIAFERDDGTLNLCVIRCASFIEIETLDQLRAALHDRAVLRAPIQSPYGTYYPQPGGILVLEDGALGTTPARIERPAPMGTEWSSDTMREYVYAVGNGRAVVLSFDYTSLRLGQITDQEIRDVMASFEFTDR